MLAGDDISQAADSAWAGGLLRAVFPGLEDSQPSRVWVDDARTLTVETAGGAVFRIATTEEGAGALVREAAVLSALRGRLSVPVPDVQWQAFPTTLGLPPALIGWPRPPGQPFLPEYFGAIEIRHIATEMGAFLASLHQFPAEDLPALPLDRPDRWARWDADRAGVLSRLSEVLQPKKYRRAELWLDRTRAVAASHHESVLVHTGLSSGSILVADLLRRIVAIDGWQSAALGDPAEDAAALRAFGDRFTRQAMASYRVRGGRIDEDFRDRVMAYTGLEALAAAIEAIRIREEHSITETLRRLVEIIAAT